MARMTGLATAYLPELQRVVQRLPLAVLAALVFALYFILGLHRLGDWPDRTWLVRIPVALTAAFLWALSAVLVAEARRMEPMRGHALAVAGFFVIVLLAALSERIDLNPLLLLGALMLLAGLAPFLSRSVRQAAFWRFNHNLWVGFLASAIGAGLFGGGLSAIVETLRYLFGIDISYTVHEKIWAVACGLVGPVYWLSVVPEDLAAEVPEGPPVEFISRMVALLCKYILVPMLIAYALILHVYAVKIGLEWSLPKGRLGWLVLSFGTMVALTALLVFPTRVSGGAGVALFWRLWPWLLIVPLALLFIAVARRIGEYGLTEARYHVVLIGFWLAVVAVAHAPRPEARDLRLLPGVLAVLLAAASLGPWGMSAWPLRAQVGAFHAVLAQAGLLQDGRIAATVDIGAKLTPDQHKRLASAIDYLNERGKLVLLRPAFAGDARDPFATGAPSPGRFDWALGRRVKDRLQIARVGPADQRRVSLHASVPAVLPLEGGRRLIGPLGLYAGASKPAIRVIEDAGGAWTVTLDRSQLTVEAPAGSRKAVFDLAALARGSGPLVGRIGGAGAPGQVAQVPLLLKGGGDGLAASLVITSLGANRGSGDSIAVTQVSFWLIVEPLP
jgi:hypothetical protein